MPKENINDMSVRGFRAEVSWAAERDGDGTGHVQLATVNQHSPFRWEMIPQKGDDAEHGKLDGWHVSLDRDGCNRLIRMLRRARDAAFGADA